jgi:hypothetical protein
MASRNITTLQGTPADVHTLLNAAAVEDVDINRALKRFGALLALFIALAVVMAIVAGISGIAPLWVVVILFIGAAVWAGTTRAAYQAKDLEDAKLAFSRYVFEAIAADLAPKKPVTVQIRHGDMFQHGIRTSHRTEGSWLTGQVEFSEYQDPWFQLRGQLQDGSLLRVGVTRSGKRKRKPKRKYTKLYDRVGDKIAVSVRVPEGAYPHLERLQNALATDRLVVKAALTPAPVQVRDRIIRLAATTGLYTKRTLRYSTPETGAENRIDGYKVLSLLAYLFAGLTHCHAGPAAPSEGR